MFKHAVFFTLSLSFCANLWAQTTASDFQAMKDYTKSLQGKSLDAIKQFNPHATFKDYNPTPTQENYYKGVETDKVDLYAPAQNALKEDAAGVTVKENFGKHQFEINQNNDAIKQAKLVEDESYAITHGLSNERVKCDEKPQACEIKNHVETCLTSQQLPNQQCVKKRRVAVASEHINQRVEVALIVHKKWTGIITVNLLTGSIINAKSGNVANRPVLTKPCESLTAKLTGSYLPYWIKIGSTPSCNNNGVLTLNITQSWDNAYALHMAFMVTIQSKPQISDEFWDNDCVALEGQHNLCHVIEEHCTDANATHTIDGLPVTRDCWEMATTYACASAKADECVAQIEKQCLQLTSHCLRFENNLCAIFEQTYNCADKVCPAPIACVKDVFCAEGDCTEHAGSQNGDFNKAVTSLAVVGEAGREYAKTQASLFAGHVVECKVDALDFIDCCSDKGWGKSLDIVHCSNEDKALGRAKLDYLAHYLGKFCAEEVLGVCLQHKRTYCVFDTKMARIIQEEGRLKQLNPNALGTAEHPVCGGISVAELQSLDMGRIEFLRPDYPFNSGEPTQAAGIVVLPPNTGNINEEVIRRIEKKVGG